MQMPAVGEIFEDKYKLTRLLGEGGFARVYLAKDIEVGRDVAIKILTPGTMGYQQETIRRFMREAKVIAGLHHPNTITMFEFGRTDAGLLFMVFEYAEGRDLYDVLRAEGALPPAVVLHVLRQLLGALAEAHDNQVLHRDIKPANVILYTYLDDPYRVKLIDFGIAKPLVERLGEPNTLTRDGVIVGTPRYMAPEQFFGEQLTPAADIYSLGLLAYEMLVGSPAIDGPNQSSLVKMAVSPTPLELPADVASPELRQLIERMMKRSARERLQSASEALRIAASIRVAEPNRGSSAAVPVASESGVRPASMHTVQVRARQKRSRLFVAAMLIGLFVPLAIVLVLTVTDDPEPAPRVGRTTVPSTRVSNALVKKEAPRELVIEEIEEPTVPDLGVADGCGAEAFTGQPRSFSARVGVKRRSWTAYAPQDYDPHRRHPIVLLFPRTNRTGADVLTTSRFARTADEHDFFVIALDALDPSKAWRSEDDVETIDVAIDQMASMYCLDRTLVYAVGDGAGGRFVANLGCQRPISATATYVYGQYHEEDICVPPGGPVPMLRVYGTKDRDVPMEGGPGCMGGPVFLDEKQHLEFWHERHGCKGSMRKWAKQDDGVCGSWSCDVPFATCGVEGGHHWPNSTKPLFVMPVCDAPIADYPLADVMWQFFQEHGRTLHP